MSGKILILLILICVAAPFESAAQKPPLKIKNITGDGYRFTNFPTKLVEPRNVDIWLPPGYDKNKNQRYPVVYMLDGQNLFSTEFSFGNDEWGIDETMTRLIAEKKIQPAIVVGVWSPFKRIIEYSPEKPFDVAVGRDEKLPKYIARHEGESDKFLKFLTSELKFYIDKTYRTKSEAADTYIIGSSMGALMALYALSEYPEIFGGAGCLSTQLTFGNGVMLEYLQKYLPAPETHKIYYDYGTDKQDRQIEPYQKKVDAIMRKKDYTPHENWLTRKILGATHSEKSWRERIDAALTFLLNNRTTKKTAQ